MDGDFLKADSNLLPEKLCGSRYEYDDRISELPDELKVMILSFLSLRKAAAASVLSSRWSGLWKHTHNLDFKFATGSAMRSWDADKCKYVKLVNTVLQSHKAPSLKRFIISFYLDKSAQLYVNKWLEFVFSRQVESLELNFRLSEEKHLAVFELEEIFRERRISSMADVNLSKSLKRLCLQCIKVSGEAIELILRGCLLLEKLKLAFIFLTSDVELCGASLMLKHLEIYYCRGEKSIRISTPHLRWIYADELSGKLLLENVPENVRADFNIVFGSQNDLQRFASGVFFCLSSQLTILNLTLRSLEMFLEYGLLKMPNLKKLVIRYCELMPSSLLPLTTLIWASPRLEEFKLEFRIPSKDWVPYEEALYLERSPHQHLKVFELAQLTDCDGDDVKELVTYIANNCIALQKIIFDACSWFHYCGQVCGFEDDEQARDYAKQQLRDKLPEHIQLLIL